MKNIKLLRTAIGQDALLAEGDMEDPADRARLEDAFRDQIDAGAYAVVPTSELDGCCRRGLVVENLSDIPRGADRVAFFQRSER